MANISYNSDEFSPRHNSISSEDQRAMLDKIGVESLDKLIDLTIPCLLYTSPSPRDGLLSRMPSSA